MPLGALGKTKALSLIFVVCVLGSDEARRTFFFLSMKKKGL